MSLWDNIGFSSCPPGQRYSNLLEMCVAEDAAGNVVTTPSGEVMVQEETNGQGQFWDKAPDYIDSLANLWDAIKGRPVQQTGPGSYGGHYPVQKDNSGTMVLLVIVGLILILITLLLFIRRKS